MEKQHSDTRFAFSLGIGRSVCDCRRPSAELFDKTDDAISRHCQLQHKMYRLEPEEFTMLFYKHCTLAFVFQRAVISVYATATLFSSGALISWLGYTDSVPEKSCSGYAGISKTPYSLTLIKMPKPCVSAKTRALEFKNEGFYVNESNSKILLCKFCNCRVEHERRDTCTKHVESKKHKLGKQRAHSSTPKRQLALSESESVLKKAKSDKEDFIVETTEAFLAAGIAVEKLDNPKLRAWLNKYVKGSGDLPSADWLRKKYIPLIKDKKEDEIKELVKNQYIVVLADESTDKMNNCVFNILFSILKPSAEPTTMLAASVVLDNANAASCSRAIVDTLHRYSVDFDKVIAYVTDSARYMNKSASTLQGLVSDSLIHIQCWAHKVNNIGSFLQNELDELNNLVSKVKVSFLNTRKRRHMYLSFLKRKYGDDSERVKLFPIPIITRWNTWFKSVLYINEYLQDILEFFEELGVENSGVKFLKNMSVEEIKVVQVQAMFVSNCCTKIMEVINFLEGSSYPTIHLLHAKLIDLLKKLELLSSGVYSEELKTLLAALSPLKQGEQTSLFRKTMHLCICKMKELLATDPAKSLLEGCGFLFNPRNLTRPRENSSLTVYQKKLPFLKELSEDEFLEGYHVLKELVKDHQDSPNTQLVNLAELLCSIKSDYQVFSVAVLKLIWIPSSNVDTERSFSKYSVIVSDRRRSLKPENAETLTMVAFE